MDRSLDATACAASTTSRYETLAVPAAKARAVSLPFTLLDPRLQAPRSARNAVRLQLHALAYNLGNFMRTLALPDSVEQWSLTTLRQKLIKIGAKIVRHGRYVIFQMAEVAIQETSSPTSCAASTGSDRRSLRHDRRHPAHPRRRQDRCIWYAAEESVCPATPANCPSIRWNRITGGRRTQASCNASGSESRSACR